MFFDNRDKSPDELRKELIDDTYAMALGAGLPAAMMEIPDIEQMSDEEVKREAKRRGLI